MPVGPGRGATGHQTIGIVSRAKFANHSSRETRLLATMAIAHFNVEGLAVCGRGLTAIWPVGRLVSTPPGLTMLVV